jgi:amino acid adenylation domain-containing protein/non-ribosomal peptide synthase protein (TIGR01720 family)
VELPLRALFEAPVLSQLAARIEEEMRAEVGVETPPLTRAERGAEVALSFAQQRLWFLDQLEPNSALYNNPLAVRLTGELKKEALERTLTEIVRRHEVLRTSFPTIDGRAVQVVAEPAPAPLPEIDLSGLEGVEREAAVQRLAQEEAAAPFNLSRGPLLRVKLLRLSERERVALMTMHHIVSDGWSMGVLINEVAALYRAYYEGGESPLPELEVQYADYAIWQRGWLQGEVLDRQVSYWREHLAGAATLELPTDRPRPAVQSHRGTRHTFTLGAGLSEGLRELSRREGATLFMTLLAGFQALLSRYSGQEDIVVGTPIAGRTRREVEPLIGFFINTLALRTKLSGDPGFREALRRVREACLGAYAHQDVPFEKLVDELQPERDLSRSPLFQVMFVLQNAPGGELELPGLTLSGVGGDAIMARFELMLMMSESAGNLVGSWIYATDLFDEATVARLSERFHLMLRAVVADPAQRIAELPLVTDEEYEQLLGWNRTEREYTRDGFIHELIEEQAERTPETEAVAFGAEELTYRELNERANRLAHFLRASGVCPEVVVGVCLERSIEMVVALLGILKAGGAYLPIDPSYPPDRISFMLEDAGVRLLLTEEGVRDRLGLGAESSPFTTLSLDADWERIAAWPTNNPAREVGPANLAYVIYTSGSTGRPKGSMLHHRGIYNRLVWMQHAYRLGAADTVLQKTSFSFDVSVWEFFWPLMTGARLVVARPGGGRDSAYLVETIQRERITALHFVPSMLQAWLPEPGVEECRSLRLVVCSGEALGAELMRRFRERLDWVELENLYGPTEASVDVTRWSCRGDGQVEQVPIGRPIWNTQMYVLGPGLELLPAGAPGELYIGGMGLARGYLRRAELTAERFIPDPYATRGGERLYRTGDIGRYTKDGEIEYLGRVDDQVKIRGYRIELGEIETALLARPSVRACAVVAREDKPGHKRLVAYVVPEGKADAAALREALGASLPEYMMPSAFVTLDTLPLTPNGKLDRRALPSPDWTRLARPLRYAPPRTAVEATLARIWADVLGVGRVGVHDNFFNLGGDSILSIQIVSRAAAAGLRLTAKDLFQHQTVAELGRLPGLAGGADSGEGWAEQGEVTGPVSLTPIQGWFFEQGRQRPHHFNQVVMLRLIPDVHAGWLREAVGALFRHHDALRLRFTQEEDGTWRQFNAAHVDQAALVHEVDLGGLDESQRGAMVTAVAEQAQRSLSLSEGPLLRAVLARMGAGQQPRLLLVVHHLAVDGVSWRILLENLQSAYSQLRGGGEVRLPAKTGSFQQWAALLTDYAASERAQAEAAYWREQAWGRAARLPKDYEGGGNRRRDARQAVAALSREQTAWLLQEAPAAYRTRIQDLLLTALAAVLAEWSGGEEVAVDIEGHGREEAIADVTRTVGWFTSIYPVLLRAELGAGAGERIKAVKEQLRSVPEGGLAYGAVRYLRADGGGLAQSGAGAEVVFNYLGQLDQVLGSISAEAKDRADELIAGAANEWAGATEDPEAERAWALEINGAVAGGQLRLRWSYSGEQYEAKTIERLANRYMEELAALVEHCRGEGAGGRTPSDYPLARLSQAEVDRLTGDGRGVEDIYPVTPMQQGMLFQTLLDPQAVGLFEQSSYQIEGGLDVRAFLAAAQEVVDRHAILRTGFAWEGVEEPLQVVYLNVKLPVEEYDWRELPAKERFECWERMCEDDRARGLDLSSAPLMRLTLARFGEDDYRLLWSNHHALLDGWCQSLVNKEVFAAYERQRGVAGSEGGVRESVGSRPFRDYVAWLQRQDLGKAEAYWRESLRGFRRPTVLPLACRRTLKGPGEEPLGDRRVRLTPEQTQRLQERGRREQVTMNTVLQGAWALLLSRYSGEADVVFGTTVSGRPAELEGVERMIGLFINTLPVRVKIEGGRGVWEWLRELQNQQSEMRQYEYSPLAQVQQWGEVGAGVGLFESLLVYENYPVERRVAGAADSGGLRIRKAGQAVRTKYPLTVVGGMVEELIVYVSYERRRFSDEAVEGVAQGLEELLARMCEEAEWPVGQAVVAGERELRARKEYEEEEREARARREAEAATAAVGQPILELVREAISEVLGGVAVGNGDNFFELGGHSLLATQLVSRIKEVFNIELPLRVLFESPVLSELAARVEVEMRAAAGVAAPPIRRVERGAEAAVSFAQQRLWFIEQLEPNNALYNSPLAVRLIGELKKEALERTLTEIVRRHEALRTTFKAVNGEPRQVVHPARPVQVAVVDVSGLGGESREAELRRLVREEAGAPFDLSRDALLRAKLLRTGETEHVALLTMHHIISDGWSTGVLINEVAALYRAYYEGGESPLPELEAQYADYALWQREWLQGEALDKQLSYWEGRLRGAATLDLPTDRPRPAAPKHLSARHHFALSEEVSEGIKALNRREGATLFMTLLAGFKVLLARQTGRSDVVVGTVVAGRSRKEVEPLIGLFINTLALRTNLSGDPSFREALRRVREACLGAYAHQDVPFEKLVQELQPEREPGRSPLFDVTFGLQNAPAGSLDLPGLTLQPVNQESERSRFDLTVWMMERGGRLLGTMTYNTDIFEEDTIRALRRRYETLLESIVRDPDERLSLLETIPQEEKEQQLSKKEKRKDAHMEKLKSVRRKVIS